MTTSTPAQFEAADEAVSEHLVFRVGELNLAVPVLNVREILNVETITPLPQAPAHTLGFIDVRDNSIAVVDLGRRIGYRQTDLGEASRIVVLEIGHGDDIDVIAILTDGVDGVTDLDEGGDRPVPSIGEVWRQDIVSGLGKHQGRSVLILDLTRIFAPQAVAA